MPRLLSIALVPFLLMIAWISHAGANGPVIPKASYGEQCVADTDVMRRDHMKLLNHQRDETVIEGVRDEPFSLVGCVDCHAQRSDNGQAIRIDAEGQFCESCHAFAAVKIDCFTCHAALPEEGKVIGYKHLHSTTVADAAMFKDDQLQILRLHSMAGPRAGD